MPRRQIILIKAQKGSNVVAITKVINVIAVLAAILTDKYNKIVFENYDSIIFYSEI